MKQKNEAEIQQFEKAKEEVIHHFMRPQTCISVYTVQQLFQDSTLKSHEMLIMNDLCRLRSNWRRSASKQNYMQQCVTIRVFCK